MSAAEFAHAIRQVGERIEIVREKDSLFFDGSIQPSRTDDASGAAGLGTDYRYVLYAALSPASQSLRPGDMLRAAGGSYQLVEIAPRSFAGKTVYLKGSLAAVQSAQRHREEGALWDS